MSGKRFAGRSVLVTGAGRGLGRACALAFARQGAAVLVNDLERRAAVTVAEEIAAAGGRAADHAADVTDERQVAEMVADCRRRFGTVDVLVNNAGILRRTSPLELIGGEEWDRVLAVNLRGCFLCLKHVLPVMKEQGRGRVVNVSSSAGRSTSTFGGAHYTAAKAALLGLSRHAAREAAPFGVTVNAVAPGSMDTEMVRELADAETIERETAAVPLGRLGTGRDQADLVTFLASDEAAYITGATVDINGGLLMI